MRTVLGLALAGLLVGAAGSPAQEKGEKIDAKKLIGKWEPTGDDLPKGAKVVIEFTDKGKVTVEFEFGGKKDKIDGTYKIDGNKLTMTRKLDGKDDTDTGTILKLTDDELEMQEEGKKKTDKLVRIKEKGKK